MVGYETSHRRRHSVVMRFDKEEVTNREWMIEFFFTRNFSSIQLRSTQHRIGIYGMKVGSVSRYRWFLSMEFVIRR